jgi:hypothetical protein
MPSYLQPCAVPALDSHPAQARGVGPFVRRQDGSAAARLAKSTPVGMLNSNYMAMEECEYATCEASFETKSGDKGRAGVERRWSVSVTGGGRFRNDQPAGRGYADDEEHHARARNYPW